MKSPKEIFYVCPEELIQERLFQISRFNVIVVRTKAMPVCSEDASVNNINIIFHMIIAPVIIQC
jgi:hypothetical protein